MISECREITSKDKEIEQGDILFFRDGKECEKFGVVITSDCDLHNHKHGKYVSYCSILSLQEYIETEFLFKKCKKMINREKEQIKKMIKETFSIKTLDDDAFEYIINLDSHSMFEYLKKEETVKYIEAYNIDKQREKFTFENFYSIMDRLNEKPPKKDKFIDSVLSELLKTLPGDKFFINDLPQQEDFGFFVNLRRIREIEISEISTEIGIGTKIYRIGRLNAPFKQKLIQTLANMFLDIGIPSENEVFREECIKDQIQGALR